MNKLTVVLFAGFVLVACKQEKKPKSNEPAANFIVNDFIKGRVAMLDTALYGFQKIETENGRSDTITISNKQVRTFAKDFLDLPDLSKGDLKDDYEVSHLFDELQEAFIFTFITKENHPVKEQYVTVDPSFDQKKQDNIRSVYVNYQEEKNGTITQKKMMWETDNFYITTITNTAGQPEKIRTVKIIWKEFMSQ